MSIKLMSAIFATKFRDLKDATGNVTKGSTAKFILLALADHADEKGVGAYPGLTRMELKTGLTRKTIVNALDALKFNGIISLVGRSKFNTSNYTILIQALKEKAEDGVTSTPPLVEPVHQDGVTTTPSMVSPVHQDSVITTPPMVSPVHQDGVSTTPPMVSPVHLNHPLTTLKPLNDDNDEEKIAAKLRMLSNLYETTIGAITPLMADLLRSAAIDYPEEWFEPAFEAAVKNNARRWVYVETILDGWQRNGFGWKPGSVDPARSKQIFGRTFNTRRGQYGEDRPRYKIPEYSEAELATIDEINRLNGVDWDAREELNRLAEGKKG